MSDPRRPPPEVTVRDPARPGRSVDVLVLGDDRPRPTRFPRRRVRAAAALLALAAVVAAGLEVRDRRAQQEQERRDAAVVDLEVLPGDDVRITHSGADVALRHVARVRNDGPREVTVLTGGIGAFGVVHEVVLRPGATAPVLLEQAVSCSAEAPPGGTSTTMTLALQTEAGVREVELELATPLEDPAPQACQATPERLVTAELVGVEVGRGSITLAVDVTTRATRPVSVLAAAADAGFAVRVPELADGPRELPLPVLDIGVGVLRLTAVVTLDDCTAAGYFRDPARPARLEVFFTGAAGDVQAGVAYDSDLLQDLVRQAC